MMVNPAANPAPAGEQLAEVDRSTEEPSNVQSKKAKVDDTDKQAPTSNPDMQQSHVQEAPQDQPVNTGGGEGGDPAEVGMDHDASTAPPAETGPVSDADWLRSKTSRVLGLLDEEEQAELDSKQQQKTTTSTEAAPETHHESGNAEVQDPAPHVDTDAEMTEAPDVDTNIDVIRYSARLFVRNLPYDATEADLEAVFAPFGKIEEVSFPIPF